MRKTLTVFGFISLCLAFCFLFISNPAFASPDTQTEQICALEHACCIDFKSSNIYVVEQNSKKLLDITNNTEQALTYEPTRLAVDYNGNIFYSANARFGIYEEQNGAEVKEFLSHKQDLTSFNIATVFDLTININNTIFAICQNSNEENLVIYKNEGQNFFSCFFTLDGIVLDTDSRIETSVDSNVLIIYANDKLFKIADGEIEDLSLNPIMPTFSNIVDIKFDFYDNLYVLDGQTMYKFDKQIETVQSFEDESFNQAISFDIDFVNGNILCLKSNSLTNVFEDDFVTILSSSVNLDYKTTIFEPFLITTNCQTNLYTHDNAMYVKEIAGEPVCFEENTKLVALTLLDSGYYYVLLNDRSTTNITGFVKENNADLVALPEEKQIRITIPNTEAFLYPTSLENLKAKKDDAVITFSKNQTLTLVQENFGTQDSNGISFCQVEFEGKNYFIDKNTIALVQDSSLTPAQDNSDSYIVFSDEQCTNAVTRLSKTENFEILERGENYIKISWGDNYVGYIRTADLDTKTMTTLQIVGLVFMIIAIITAVFLCLYFALRKPTNKYENEKIK